MTNETLEITSTLEILMEGDAVTEVETTVYVPAITLSEEPARSWLFDLI